MSVFAPRSMTLPSRWRADVMLNQASTNAEQVTDTQIVSRRRVVQGLGGLILAVSLPRAGRAQSGAAQVLKGEAGVTAVAPNAFVRIGSDNTVTVLVKHIEFGQGPFTGLATLV